MELNQLTQVLQACTRPTSIGCECGAAGNRIPIFCVQSRYSTIKLWPHSARGGSRTHKITLVLSQQHIPFLLLWHIIGYSSIGVAPITRPPRTRTYYTSRKCLACYRVSPFNLNRAINYKLFNKIELTRALYALILLINCILAHSA